MKITMKILIESHIKKMILEQSKLHIKISENSNFRFTFIYFQKKKLYQM